MQTPETAKGPHRVAAESIAVPVRSVPKTLLFLYATHADGENVQFFLRHGLAPLLTSSEHHETVRVLFIVNGGPEVAIANLAALESQPWARVIRRDNVALDFGAWAAGLALQKADASTGGLERWTHYLFVNSTVRGPMLPVYARHRRRGDRPWWDLFLAQLSTADDSTAAASCALASVGIENADAKRPPPSSPAVKLVGTTINVFCDAYSETSVPRPHVQSMVLATDAVGLRVAFDNDIFSPTTLARLDKWPLILHCEVGWSTALLRAGYNIACLQPEYADVDFRAVTADRALATRWLANKRYWGDAQFKDGAFQRSLHPYDVVFLKTNRDIDPRTIEFYSALQTAADPDDRSVVLARARSTERCAFARRTWRTRRSLRRCAFAALISLLIGIIFSVFK